MKQLSHLTPTTEADVQRLVYQIIADTLVVDIEMIQHSSRFREDLGADSLDLVHLIIACSNIFTIKVCDGNVPHMQTVGEAIAYLQQNLAVDDAAPLHKRV
jgi:acyl carrier protein